VVVAVVVAAAAVVVVVFGFFGISETFLCSISDLQVKIVILIVATYLFVLFAGLFIKK
jgi:hypothetical protein